MRQAAGAYDCIAMTNARYTRGHALERWRLVFQIYESSIVCSVRCRAKTQQDRSDGKPIDYFLVLRFAFAARFFTQFAFAVSLSCSLTQPLPARRVTRRFFQCVQYCTEGWFARLIRYGALSLKKCAEFALNRETMSPALLQLV